MKGFFQFPKLPPFVTLAGFGFHGKFIQSVVDGEKTFGGEGSDSLLLTEFIFDEEVEDFKLVVDRMVAQRDLKNRSLFVSSHEGLIVEVFKMSRCDDFIFRQPTVGFGFLWPEDLSTDEGVVFIDFDISPSDDFGIPRAEEFEIVGDFDQPFRLAESINWRIGFDLDGRKWVIDDLADGGGEVKHGVAVSHYSCEFGGVGDFPDRGGGFTDWWKLGWIAHEEEFDVPFSLGIADSRHEKAVNHRGFIDDD